MKRLLMAPLFLTLSLEAMPLIAQSAPDERTQTAQASANTDDDKSDAAPQAPRAEGGNTKKNKPNQRHRLTL